MKDILFIKNVIDTIWQHMDFDTFLIVTNRRVGAVADRTALKRRYKNAFTRGLDNLSEREQDAIIKWAMKVVEHSESPDLQRKEKSNDTDCIR